MTGGRSAVVLMVPVPASIRRIRALHDPMARRGVPPHVTLVFPFVPAVRLGKAERQHLAAIAGEARPFSLRFADVRRFPSSLYLAPEPTEPVHALIAAVVRAFPDHPPNEGAFEAVIPHLTVAADAGEAVLAGLVPAAQAPLPFSAAIRALTVLAEDEIGQWRTHWRIPLGTRRP